MTRVVFAPDSFKGSVTAREAARALAEGWREEDPSLDAILLPMADGGEGTLAAFEEAVPGSRRVPVEVSAPAPGMRGIRTSWLMLPPDDRAPQGTGVVELASTAGIERFGARLDPWHASSYGFGQAIGAALDAGVSRLILAIGSSASTDGGAGVLSALGARFEGGDRAALAAADLAALVGADLTGLRPLPPEGAVVLTDVTSPLLGPTGAAATFGPQKGFAASDLASVDRALSHYAGLLGGDPMTTGSGAAGGCGFGLLAWGARLRPGADEVAGLIKLGDAVASARLVITGEGAYDPQSALNKVPAVVARLAGEAGVRSALVAGRISPEADTERFVTALSLTTLAGSSDEAQADARGWLREAGATLARQFSAPVGTPVATR